MGIISYYDVTQRMRWAGKLKNDSALARVFGITPQALSNYKKRGTLPSDLIIRCSNIYGVSIDWLVFGTGNIYKLKNENKDYSQGCFLETAIPQSTEEERGVAQQSSTTTLTLEELVYTGKLLKILRGDDKTFQSAVKLLLDSYYD